MAGPPCPPITTEQVTKKCQPTQQEGVPVFPDLLRKVTEENLVPEGFRLYIATMLAAREQTGIRKYGQTLMTTDGLDHSVEAVQEMLDAMAYLNSLVMSGVPLEGITVDLLHTLVETVGALVSQIPRDGKVTAYVPAPSNLPF